jgi:hypothetical protein
MSSSGSKGMLTAATRQLLASWEETRQTWRDRKADEFEKTYLADLAGGVNAAIRVMEDLDQLLHKIHADCE